MAGNFQVMKDTDIQVQESVTCELKIITNKTNLFITQDQNQINILI